MWMQCYTQEEIASEVNLTKEQVSEILRVCQNLETFPKSDKLSISHQDQNFEIPLFNIWSFAKKTNNVSHFGNTEQRIVLL